jgi:hypothetical protein
MMYNNKLVASVKVAGKIMREDGETVYLPFGSQYSLLLKNLNTRKALVKVEIDGEDVTGGGLIVSPNQTVDFERYILDDNLDAGPKFKFIEKTERISDNRGDRVEDGLVRVTYQFEAAPVYTNTYYRSGWDIPLGGNSFYNCNVGSSIGTTSVDAIAKGTLTSTNDSGITTKGSESDQKFQYGSIGTLESTTHAIVLQLKGQIGQHVVKVAQTVQVKFKCDVCGKGNIPSGNKFCPECGTNLTVKW